MAVTEDGVQQIMGRKIKFFFLKTINTKCIDNLLQCKIAFTKFKSPNLGMETLLNAPLHASQQQDKVSLKSLCSVALLFYQFRISYHCYRQ